MSPPDLCLVAAAWFLLALVHRNLVWALFYMVSTTHPNATQRAKTYRSELHISRITTQRMHDHGSQHHDDHPRSPIAAKTDYHRSPIAAELGHAFRSGAGSATARDCAAPSNPQKKKSEKEWQETTFQIFCKVASRRSIAVDVRLNDTIGHVKRMVEDAEGIPADALPTIYGGKQCEDDDTVASLNIKQEVMVHITCRLHGGVISRTMNSIPIKHVPRAVSGLLDEYHRTQRKKKITKISWKDLTSSDLQAVVQALDPCSATAHKVASVSKLFLVEDPDVALSYRWSSTLGDIYDGLCTACCPDETVWIDILFNAQNAELTPQAVLELTPKRYQNARRHLLLVTSTQDLVDLLTRGWICFEIAVRMISDKPMVELVDPHCKASELYQSGGGLSRDFFKAMETFDPKDTILIQRAIRQLFTQKNGSFLTSADPALNFNRSVGDFVHLTGGKLFIANLANQANNVRTVTAVDPGNPLGKGRVALVCRLLLFYAVHTPKEAIGTVKVKCKDLLDKLYKGGEGWFGEKPMLREWLQDGDGLLGEKELLRQWSLTSTWLGTDEDTLNRWLAAEVGSDLSELSSKELRGQLMFFHSCATPTVEVGQILRTCEDIENKGQLEKINCSLRDKHGMDLCSLACWQRVTEEAWTLSDKMFVRAKFADCLFVRERLLTALQHLHGHKHLDVATSLMNIGIVYEQQGELELALAKHEESLRIKIGIVGHEHLDVAKSLLGIGNVYLGQGELGLALPKYEQALAIQVKHHGHEHLDVAASLNNIGIVYLQQGELGLALAKHEEAQRIRVCIVGHKHLDVAASLNNIGSVYQQQGELGLALAKYEESIRIKVSIVGHEHLDVAKTEENIGNVYFRQGELGLALPKYEFALRIKTRDLGHEHLDVAKTEENIGNVYFRQGKFGLALPKYEFALRIKTRYLGHEHLDVAMSLMNIGNVYDQQGEFGLALAKHEESLRIKVGIVGHEHPDVAASLDNLGIVYQEKGNLPEALAKHNEALRIRRLKLGDEHPDVATSLDNLGKVQLKIGNLPEALAKYNEALRIRRSKLGDEHPHVAASFRDLAVLAWHRQDWSECARRFDDEWRIKSKVLGPEHKETRDAHQWLQQAKKKAQ